MARVLYSVLGPPVAWSLHFLLVYFLVALGCSTGWNGAPLMIGLVTLPFAALSAGSGVVGYHGWRSRQRGVGPPRAVAGAEEWLPFMMLMGVLGSVLFTGVILVESLPAFTVEPCSALR